MEIKLKSRSDKWLENSRRHSDTVCWLAAGLWHLEAPTPHDLERSSVGTTRRLLAETGANQEPGFLTQRLLAETGANQERGCLSQRLGDVRAVINHVPSLYHSWYQLCTLSYLSRYQYNWVLSPFISSAGGDLSTQLKLGLLVVRYLSILLDVTCDSDVLQL